MEDMAEVLMICRFVARKGKEDQLRERHSSHPDASYSGASVRKETNGGQEGLQGTPSVCAPIASETPRRMCAHAIRGRRSSADLLQNLFVTQRRVDLPRDSEMHPQRRLGSSLRGEGTENLSQSTGRGRYRWRG